jgi:hypothetical protein
MQLSAPTGVFRRVLGALGCASLLFLALTPPSFCAEAGLGAYWPGYRSFMTGLLPPKPGLYLRNDVVSYRAHAQRVVLNGLPVEDVSAHVTVEIVELTYVFPKTLLGARHAALLTQPYIWSDLSGLVVGPDIEASGKHAALGDLVVSPLYLGWDKGKLHYNASLAVFIPTGDYDVHRVANTGLNHWTLDPQFGITHFDPKTGWDFSGALGYSINYRNDTTNYKSGDVLHVDYAIGKQLKNGFKPGVVGYAWLQVTPDTGRGALFGPFKSRVYGIGPGVVWRKGKGPELRFRYYHEFGAKDRLEGNQSSFTFRLAF